MIRKYHSFDAIFSPKLYQEAHAKEATYGCRDLHLLMIQCQFDDGADALIDRERCLWVSLLFKHHTRLMNHMTFPEYV